MSAESTATNYYAVLKISQDASLQEINAAYKRLALKYHPDKSGEGSVETFHQIKEAAEALRDSKRRLEHDEALGDFHENEKEEFFYFHGNKKREFFDFHENKKPRNFPLNHPRKKEEWEEWQDDHPNWRNEDLLHNLRNHQDCYMYSYGSSVHMDPNSEESMAESARRSAEADKWEAEYAAMHAEYEADQRQEEAQTSDRPRSEPYLDEELEELSGSELETTKQVQYRTLGWESPDEFSDSELLAKEKLEPDIWADDDMSIYEQQPDFSADATYNDLARGGPCSFFGPYVYAREPQFNSAPASPIETEDLFGGYQNPLDDYEDYLGEIELGLRDPPLSWAVEPSQEQYPDTDPQIVTAKGPLEPFCQYFNEKLADSSLQYTFEDLTTEINGMLVGVFSDWVLALKDKPRVSPMTINPDGSKACSHVCEWRKDFDVLECPACHIGKPIYTATCSGCGIERCLCCK